MSRESPAHMQARIAAEYGVTADADMLSGTDENRMRRQAERLRELSEDRLARFAGDVFGRPSTRALTETDTEPGRHIVTTEGGEPPAADNPMRDMTRTVFRNSDLD